MRVLTSPYTDVCINDLLDGQVAVINRWEDPAKVGKIVQRHNDVLVPLGEPAVAEFEGIFQAGNRLETCRVLVLPSNTTLIV